MPNPIHTHDHEIIIGSTTERLRLMRDDSGKAMYSVQEKIPQYREPLMFVQSNWTGGHGQYDFKKPTFYLEGQSIDTTQDGRIILAPLIYTVLESDDTNLDSAVAGFCWFPAVSKWLCYTAGKVYLYGTKWTAATTTLAGVTDMKVMGTIIYAAMGASTKYYYSSDGDTWTQTDLTDGYANKFLVSPNSAGSADVLWKFKTANEVASTTDGRTIAAGGVEWTTPNYIGDTSSDITNIFLCNDRLFIGKTDSLWHLDSEGGIHNLRPELSINRTTENFQYVTHWQVGTYFSEGSQLGEITAGNAFAITGSLYGIDDIGKAGTTIGLTADRDAIYHAIDEGTNSHIYKLREVRSDIDEDGYDELHWEICPFVYLGTNACAAIEVCQHSTTDKRLWFGYGTATGYVKLFDNPTADSNATFCAAGWVRFSYDYGTNPVWDKMWQSVITQTKGCVTGGTLTNGTGIATGSPITLTGGANTITVSQQGTFTVVIPAGSAGIAATGTGVTVAGSPQTLAVGSNTVTVTGTGTFTVTVDLISVRPSYYKDTDTTNTNLTAAITSNGTVKTYLTSAISCNRISFRIDFATNDSSKTPELLYFEARGIEKPEVVRVHDCTYTIGNEPSNRVKTIRTTLRGARTSTSLVKFADLRYGDSTEAGYVYVVAEPGTPQEVEIKHEKTNQPELGINVRWREVNFS